MASLHQPAKAGICSGRRLIGTSDITSFYEDVDLGLLRDVLRTRVRKANRPLANFLVEMYQDWAARDVHFMRQDRGIPQGTNSSGVVANYYLMPFDEALDLYARRKQLRSRAVSSKRSLALREFALGIEALERFVRNEPLRRVHECVFGVLALESEPVDPRL